MKPICEYCRQDTLAEDILNVRTCDKKDCVHHPSSAVYASKSYFIVASYSAAIEDVMQKVEALEMTINALQYQINAGEKPEGSHT